MQCRKQKKKTKDSKITREGKKSSLYSWFRCPGTFISPSCKAEVYTIHLLLNALMEAFQLEHKFANEKWEISLYDRLAFMQRVLQQAQLQNTLKHLNRAEQTGLSVFMQVVVERQGKALINEAVYLS